MDHPKMEKAIREVQDALVVQGELEARLSRGLKQAAEWLESRETRLAEIQKETAEMREQYNLLQATSGSA